MGIRKIVFGIQRTPAGFEERDIAWQLVLDAAFGDGCNYSPRP
jgi:hypothetical protein